MSWRGRITGGPLYLPASHARALAQRLWLRMPHSGGTRSYCVSPYKTGTTYLASLFKQGHRAAHEPLHFVTLHRRDDVRFLARRHRALDLDLECSGFLALSQRELRAAVGDVPFVYLNRDPRRWIRSVLGHFDMLREAVSYNFVARRFFDPLCGEHIDQFHRLDHQARARVSTRLLSMWTECFRVARADPRTLVVRLEDLDDRLAEVEDHIGLRAGRPERARKRTARRTFDFDLNDHVDLSEWRGPLEEAGYEL